MLAVLTLLLEICKKKSQLNWFSAKNIDLAKLFEKNYELISQPISNINFPNFPLKLIDSNKVVINLVEKNCRNIIEAESQHSDLLPAKYEGGLKIWECTYDLGKYLLSEKIAFNNKTILDLGCGAGIIGLLALLQGSLVDFQDYNNEVIEFVTIPNVILNCYNYKLVEETCKFYTGDWESFSNLLASNSAKSLYDFIFTSETIYNPDNHQKLYQIFKQHLKKNGIGYVAGKTYYFGVGGGMRQFEKLVLRDNIFDVQVVWKSNEGKFNLDQYMY
ncbi:PREDICTED: histidine protein methyltransferase 1 homolog [Ceratosolen solmsi marchali]|uniref:protein-histidine N-methyltransferase n=1 Tax=Ceratosolen solmsi marchali TaxID=326594 RepID=A0AAJ6YFP3_9HYME|nr:PREDICTED: histidine protein methyltransferase 1 homolog [Ceratosolen solmsi marchali]